MEANLRMPDCGHEPVVVAGQAIEIGEESCMLFTFLDLEPHRKAEILLWQSEESFQKAFRMLPVPSAVLRAQDFVLLDMNDTFSHATGYAAIEALCHGHSDKEIAKKLEVALSTVRNHVANIYMKLDVHNRNAALLWARNHGYFRTGQ